jgi:hypothetical protein
MDELRRMTPGSRVGSAHARACQRSLVPVELREDRMIIIAINPNATTIRQRITTNTAMADTMTSAAMATMKTNTIVPALPDSFISRFVPSFLSASTA